MDDIDRATEHSQRVLDDTLARQRSRAMAAAVPCMDPFCVGCGDPISIERRRALPSAKRCVGCQEAVDFESRQHRRIV